jgi:hypothetical protein
MLASAPPCHAALMFRPTPYKRPAIPAIDRRWLVQEMRRIAMAAQQDVQARRPLVEALSPSLRGEVLDPAHPAYDDARRVWNGPIDRYPR